ncbi:GM23681 [Drosophila sechellia]|uniref:GM23681 n=1 Tax=Drosophila sechellia TaxID=7238 RepID=B4HM70_DROSE|nr:GM23681 [Drosophila sechellia]
MEMEITACGSKWQMCVTVTATPRGFLPVAVAAGQVAASVAPTADVTANQVPMVPNRWFKAIWMYWKVLEEQPDLQT